MRIKSIIILATASLLWACGHSDSKSNKTTPGSDSTQVAAVYQCPMDCEKGKTYEKEGKCPVCGMDLELKTKE
jgi:hypothetical protein